MAEIQYSVDLANQKCCALQPMTKSSQKKVVIDKMQKKQPLQFKPVCRFGDKVLDVLFQLSHDHMCELLTGLVEVKTTSSVHKAPQLLQLFHWQAT